MGNNLPCNRARSEAVLCALETQAAEVHQDKPRQQALLGKPLQVTVNKLSGQLCVVSASLGWSARELKKEIHRLVGVPTRMQRLFVGPKSIDDSEVLSTLLDEDMESAVLNVSLLLRNGEQDCQELVASEADSLVARLANSDEIVESLMQPCMSEPSEVQLMMSIWEAILRVCRGEEELAARRIALTTPKLMRWVLTAIAISSDAAVQCRGCRLIDRLCYNNNATRKQWVEAGAVQVVCDVMKRYQDNKEVEWAAIFWAFWHLALHHRGNSQFNELGIKDLLRPGRPMRARIDEVLLTEPAGWLERYDPLNLLSWGWLQRYDPFNFLS